MAKILQFIEIKGDRPKKSAERSTDWKDRLTQEQKNYLDRVNMELYGKPFFRIGEKRAETGQGLNNSVVPYTLYP